MTDETRARVVRLSVASACTGMLAGVSLALFFLGDPLVAALMLVPVVGMTLTLVYEVRR